MSENSLYNKRRLPSDSSTSSLSSLSYSQVVKRPKENLSSSSELIQGQDKMADSNPPPVTPVKGVPYQLTSTPATIPPVVNISDHDVMKIALTVKQMMMDEIHTTVQAIVNTELAGMKESLAMLAAENKELRQRIDDQEMHSRRDCIRIFGVSEDRVNTDEVVHELASKLDVPLQKSELAVSHRVGRKSDDKPRPIIARITNYNIRHRLLKSSKNLRKVPGMTGVNINQDLTKSRSKFAYEARQMVKSGCAKSTFVWDGKVFVIDHHDVKHKIICLDDMIRVRSLLI